jgi:large subunit ribosomal protein L4
MKCQIVDISNKKVKEIELDKTVFGLEVRSDILSRAVNWQLSKRQSGNHKTKQRSEVKGSTIKPFKQKGTGRARQGDKKAPQMRGGGVAFGPVVRSHAHKLTKKVRRLALCTALSSKYASGNLVILDEAKTASVKTSELAKRINVLGWKSALIIDGDSLDENFFKAAQNIRGLDVMPQQGANVYDILRKDTLVLTIDAVEALAGRLK